MAGERSARKTKMIKSRFLEYSRNVTWSSEDGNEVAQEVEADCGKEF